ncbi:MAG TPA: YhbY family RNA-binding protein [Burkholderiaceae bacterium]
MEARIAAVLTPAQRRGLRAQAHHLKPVVIVGEAGLTQAVLAEADAALRAHQLVKIRVLGDERAARAQLMESVCAALACAAVQSIGKLLVVYRPQEDDGSDASRPGGGARKRRGPHRPKKSLGAKAESPPRARGATPAKAKAKAKSPGRAGTAGAAGGKTGGIKMASVSRKSLSEKTAGKKTDLGSNVKLPSRSGAPKRSTQGPVHLQGLTAPRTRGRRNRAKSGS